MAQWLKNMPAMLKTGDMLYIRILNIWGSWVRVYSAALHTFSFSLFMSPSLILSLSFNFCLLIFSVIIPSSPWKIFMICHFYLHFKD